MSCHRRNPTTLTFPGGRGSADGHPPVLSLSQIPLKECDEANVATYYVICTLAASSSLALSLIMGETDLSIQNKGRCLFSRRPFISGVFLHVRVLAFDV